MLRLYSFLFVFFLAGTASAATLYVDARGSNPRVDGSERYPYRTIHAAVSSARSHDTIRVLPGEYPETIDLRIPLVIESTERGGAHVLPAGPWRVRAPGTVLRGLRFTTSSSSIAIQATAYFSLEKCQIEGARLGLSVKGTHGAVIKHNRFLNNQIGLRLVSAGATTEVAIENNIFVADGTGTYGIHSQRSDHWLIHNTIVGYHTGVWHRGTERSSFLDNNLIVAGRSGVVAQSGLLLLQTNAIRASTPTSGVPSYAEVGTRTDDCGAPVGAYPADFAPSGGCVDAGSGRGDPDGSPADIGHAGGAWGGRWWQDLWCRGALLECTLHPVDAYLQRHPHVADHVVFWDSYDLGWVPWRAWSFALKEALRRSYDEARAGTETYLPPPANDYLLDDDAPRFATALRDEDARRLYLSQLAHSLLVEIDRRVPWSLSDLAIEPEAYADLFDARRTYWESRRSCLPLDRSLAPTCFSAVSRCETSATRRPLPAECADTAFAMRNGEVIPMQGSQSLSWILDATLRSRFTRPGYLGMTPLGAIATMVEWERDHLTHYIGPWTAQGAEYYWGQRSLPPAERMLFGPAPSGRHPHTGTTTTHEHFTNGCGSVGELAGSVLKVINVPTDVPVFHNGHGGIHFRSEGMWLSHGDLLTATWGNDPYYLTVDLFLNDAEFSSWFPESPTRFTDQAVVYDGTFLNVETPLLVLENLPHIPSWITAAYCNDRATGRAQTDSGSTYARFFARYFTFDEMESRYGFWSHLESWAAARGCP